MTGKTKFILIGVGVIVMGGFVTLSVSRNRQPSVEVRLEKVQRRDLVSIVTASGKIQPQRSVDVSSDITGRIVGLPVVEGQPVGRGQVVVRIDVFMVLLVGEGSVGNGADMAAPARGCVFAGTGGKGEGAAG